MAIHSQPSPAKRRRLQSESTTSIITPTTPLQPTQPQLSAKAARNQQLAQSALQQQPTVLPRHAQQSDDDEEDDDQLQQVIAQVLSSGDEQQDPTSSSRSKQPRQPKQKQKGAGRYFAGTVDQVPLDRPATRPTSGASTEQDGGATAEETFEEAARTAGKSSGGKMGRGKRQRREKSAFLDPSCFSSFAPSAGSNAFRVHVPDSDGQQRDSALFCLAEGETLIIHGNYTLTPIHGSSSMLGALLSASPSTSSSLSLPSPAQSPSHRVFSPSSHPLPPLLALPSPSSPSASTLSLPSGDQVDLSPFAAVVLVQEMNSEVEGVETVLRNSGMGCGNGMWEADAVDMRKEQWEGRGWRLILEPTPSLTSLRTLDSWEATLASFGVRARPIKASRPVAVEGTDDGDEEDEEEEEEELVAGAERLVLLVEGPKRVGKSTFTKMLLNRLLSRYETVAYLDTDLGQPEFTTPGFVSLNVVQQPVLGPSFTHLSLPVSSHFIGNTSPASDPSAYLSAISSLLSTFRHDVEYPITDEAPRRRGAAHTAAGRPTSKIRDRVPLIINTQGWVKGLGADLLAKLKAEARPTHLVVFEAAEEEGGSGGSTWDAPNNNTSDYRDPSCQVVRLAGAPSSPLDSKWSAADLRTLAFISYFHAIFPRDVTPSDAPRLNTFPSSWDFSTPLVARTPFAVDWTAEAQQIGGVHLLDSDVPYEQVLYALNGTVVALVSQNEGAEVEQSTSSPTAFPLLHSPASSSTSRSLGLALIRSIDPITQTLHLLTPVNSSHLGIAPLILVKGAIDLPLPLQLDFNANEVESSKGVCGTEWREVPYLSVEGGEGGRKKVRRNLMRRGQA